MAQYDIFRHHLAIKYPAYGHALWEPSPAHPYPAVEVGDVGFIRGGRFHRLFNVLLPAEDPSHENFGVPESHEQLTLNMKNHIVPTTLSPNDLCSAGVDMVAISRVLATGPDSPTEVVFSCRRRKQGAVLSLPTQAKCKDTVALGDFGKWMIKHIDSWFAWVRRLGVGIVRMEDIILVTGTHHTRSWTNVAFPGGQEDAKVSFGANVTTHRANVATDGANVATRGDIVDINWKFSREYNRGAAVLSCGPNGKDLPEDQCVFIRGFRVIRKLMILPRELKAAAGPNPDPRGDDPEPDVELMPLQVVPEYRDPLHILLEYIAEEAPNDMALVHDDDLARIIDGLGDTSLESLQPDTLLCHLRSLKPKIQDVLLNSCVHTRDAPSGSSANANTGTPRVAMLSTIEERSPSPTFFDCVSESPRSETSAEDPSSSSQPTHSSSLVSTQHDPGSGGLPPLPWIVDGHLLTQVFTQCSLSSMPKRSFEDSPDDPSPDNEELVYIGNLVLSLVVTDLIRDLFPHLSFGPSSKIRDRLTHNVRSARIAVSYRLHERLQVRASLSASEVNEIKASKYAQADVFKAYVGGLYREQGMGPVNEWLRPLFQLYVQDAYAENPIQAAGPAARVEEATSAPAVETSQQLEPSIGQWSSTLSEIKQKIESLASATLQRLPLEQREPAVLVSLRRIALRVLMYCASLSTADFASPNGFLGPPDCVSYYPTGDLEGDRNVAFTTALDCIDELMILLTGNGKSEIAGALSELAQALNDLGLHGYASSVSGFALEIFRDLYAAEPDRFRSRLVSVQSLRANILVDLKQNDDAADAAEEAVTILKDNGNAQTELVYAMLNYAVLLGSIGRGEGAAAVAFELMGFFEDPTNIQPDLVLVSSLCELCVSNACIEFDTDLALSEAEKAIEASRTTLDGNSKVVLAGALLTKSKILSSEGQTDHAYAVSAEAVTLFRSVSVDRHAYSLLLAHALHTHSHQLSEANRRVESFPVISEAVELWQALQISAPVATKRPLAWALFELAKYRFPDSDKQKLRNELQIAESAVSTFRDVEPLDYAGLADALYLYADRMLELDKNREASTYAEESVQYFREANEETPHKYALDLIFALTLASSCLACTERSESALEYAKEAVALQHEREGEGETQHYGNHLRKLLFDVVHRGTEMGRQEDILPWMRELEQLGEPEGVPLARPGGKPQPKNDTEFRKQTSYWMDAGNPAPKLSRGSTSSAGARTPTPTPAPQLDEGRGREVTPSAEPSKPPVDKGKARAVTRENPFSSSSNSHRLSEAEEEILSPAAATATAQRRRDALAGMGPPRGGSFGSGNNNDLLSGLLMGGGMGGRTLGGSSGPMRSINDDRLSGLLGGMGGMGGRTMGPPSSPPPMGPNGRPLGSPIPQTVRAPSSGRAGGGRVGGMDGLGGFDPSGGRGGLGGMDVGGFDPGMFGPELFRGSNKDKADGDNEGISGTGTRGGDDTPRSGTWSGTGIQRNFG